MAIPSKVKVGSVRTHKVGFRPSEMLKAQARGKIHDPNVIDSVEISMIAANQADLHTPVTIVLVLQEARRHSVRLSRVSGKAVCRESQGGWVRWFEVD